MKHAAASGPEHAARAIFRGEHLRTEVRQRSDAAAGPQSDPSGDQSAGAATIRESLEWEGLRDLQGGLATLN